MSASLVTFASWSFAHQSQAADSLGFVITDWRIAKHETRFIDECPQGLSPGNDEIWWRSLPVDERSRLTGDGGINRQNRYQAAVHRGPNRENVCVNPEVVTDPPLLIVQGRIAPGFNLDGDSDGMPGKHTCAHENFTSPDGVPGIDNQLYRLTGCVQGYRTIGYLDTNPNENRRMQGKGIILIEVTGVDSARNDPDVEVGFFLSQDGYVLDSNDEYMPWASYRSDNQDGAPRYGGKARGQIEDGVLTTEPTDLNLPNIGNFVFINMLIRDMRLRLEIADDGARASGMIGGYQGVDQAVYQNNSLGIVGVNGYIDCPAFYVAAHQLADGHPDPTTGRCTSLSGAWKIEAVAAFVAHGARSGDSTKVAQADISLGDRAGAFKSWLVTVLSRVVP